MDADVTHANPAKRAFDDGNTLTVACARAFPCPASTATHGTTFIREDRERRAGVRLEALLLEGISSGDPVPLDAAEWADLRQEVKERIGGKRRHG